MYLYRFAVNKVVHTAEACSNVVIGALAVTPAALRRLKYELSCYLTCCYFIEVLTGI